MRYEKVDLWIGIVIVVVGGAALMGATAAAFAGTRHGQFTDAAGLAPGSPRTPGIRPACCSRSRCSMPR